ncbi:MAG: hypothetical protein KF729_23705, partial [Sandaracinaceae bacterium]|nr:hypothetical protein [Sandaracinaceae bacterium]
MALAGAPCGHARAEGLSLSWSAPPGCPDRATVAAQIEELLGRALVAAPPARVEAAMARDGGRLRLDLELVRGDEPASTRTLEGPTCEALAEAGALVIALAIDPDAVAARQRAREGAPPEAAPEPAPAPTPTPALL